MGTLNVDVTTDGGTTWNNEWTLSGDQGLNWNESAISLACLLYTSPSPRDRSLSRMPSSA